MQTDWSNKIMNMPYVHDIMKVYEQYTIRAAKVSQKLLHISYETGRLMQ